MEWDPSDIRTAPNMLINHGFYEPEELLVLEYFSKGSNRIAFDIGANTGWYSLHMGHVFRKTGGRVYAFEPIPSTFEQLRRNISLNGFENVVFTHNMALGDTETTAEFFIPEFSGSVAASQRRLFVEDKNASVKCRVMKLDTFVAEQKIPSIHLIKCDVEGAELSVLKGGKTSIKKHLPVIMLEMLRKWARAYNYHPNDIIAFLNGLGYGCWSFRQGQFEEYREIDDACLQTNFFFFHREAHREKFEEAMNQLSKQ